MASGFVGTSKVRFDINTRAIGSFTRTAGGMVTRWNLGVTNDIKQEAAVRTEAGTQKYGTGLLARSFTVVLVNTGESHCEVHVKNKQPYAKFKFLGTRPIIGTGKKLMPVGKSQLRIGNLPTPRGYFFNGEFKKTTVTPKYFVKGQVGNNFPRTAMRLVLTRRRILIR